MKTEDMNSNISIIAAVADGNAIGRKGGLLCHLPADLKRFKSITSGHTVIMGRKTFDSLPNGALPNRRNIVVTRNKSFSAADAESAYSLETAFAMSESDDEVFVIGGAQIYKEAMPYADKLYVTKIEASFPDADTFFPEIGDDWTVEKKEVHPADEKNQFTCVFLTLVRNRM